MLLSLMDLLDRSRFEPLVVTQRESPLTEGLRERSIETEVVPLPPVLDVYEGKALRYGPAEMARTAVALARYNERIRRLAASRDVELIWCRNIKTVLFTGLAARRLGIPLVWDVGLEAPSRGVARVLHVGGLAAASTVVNQAASQHRLLFGDTLANVGASKLRTIDAAVASDRLETLRRAEERRSRESRRPTLLNVGPISPRKNQLVLLGAVERLAARIGGLRVLCVGPVGDQDYWESVKRFAHEHGLEDTVEFLGWRDDVAELMGESDVFVLSSRGEGFPQVLREAMHAALPVVATRVGGMVDAVAEGETGYLVPVDDPDSLAEALGELLLSDELRQRMGAEARRIARERFSPEGWARSYESLLEELVSKPRRRWLPRLR